MTLTDAAEHIGAGVVYQAPHGDPEDGVITGVSSAYVFVRYATQHPAADGRATPAQHLTLLAPR